MYVCCVCDAHVCVFALLSNKARSGAGILSRLRMGATGSDVVRMSVPGDRGAAMAGSRMRRSVPGRTPNKVCFRIVTGVLCPPLLSRCREALGSCICKLQIYVWIVHSGCEGVALKLQIWLLEQRCE